jgi:S1-C subfamily serine protease
MGYAINIREAMPMITTLISNGHIVRPWSGSGVYTVDQSVAAYYHLAVSKGMLVTDVATGSPADKAGILPGDVITAINGQVQTDDAALIDLINSFKIG